MRKLINNSVTVSCWAVAVKIYTILCDRFSCEIFSFVMLREYKNVEKCQSSSEIRERGPV